MKAFSADLDVRLTEVSLRDGSHHIRHQFTAEQVAAVARALDQAGVPVIEVSHGDGLGGSSLTYGRSRTDERVLIATAVANVKRAKIASLILPGVGTSDDIRAAADLGVGLIRVATHCTEADIGAEHFHVARSLGLDTAGFLMMAHSQPPEVLARQARIMVDAGCRCVYVTDSAGALILEQVADRVATLVAELGDDAMVGFHGHENLALGVANTIVAIRAGAVQVDASARRFGAGAGNTPTEALVPVCEKLGIRTGVDPLRMFDVAEDVVLPILKDGEPALSRLALVMGYAGVYSSFLKHAYRAGERYGVSGAEILMRCGQRKLVGGQEDQILDIASELAAERTAANG
ncbi:MAG TPA: 4-hydroxy-2-oxovalerate aldolase [Deltaproteobacteria bacterium]|jgi:4-hydroxy 2-oxovalerate aldolase|nr:4-hydroxy-2-oxovalerate aldolase [Deltaproteobacteria bacterium]